jgi:hypothetical protein
MSNVDTGDIYHRYKWLVQPAFPLMGDNGREKFFQLDIYQIMPKSPGNLDLYLIIYM